MKTTTTHTNRIAGFAAHSHPEPEDRRLAVHDAGGDPRNPSLRTWLRALRDRPDWSNPRLGRALGYQDGSTVSRYLAAKYSGFSDDSLLKFEQAIRDLQARLANLRAAADTGLLDTNVVAETAAFASKVRDCLDVGLLTGDAGVGKTTALAAYVAAHPTALMVTANAIQRDERGVKQVLWAAFDHRKHDHNRPRYPWLVEHLSGSDRLLIIDRAQRLTRGGLDVLYDIHDDSGIPILLCGNPSIISRCLADPQNSSRTFEHHSVALDNPAEAAAALVGRLLPEHAPVLAPLAEALSCEPGRGRLRAVVKSCKIVAELLQDRRFAGDPAKAWRTAQLRSVHHADAA